VGVDRDPAAVVDDADRSVLVERDVDFVTVAREGLVDRVVDDLVNEMVESTVARGSDVHRRTLPNGLEPLQNLNLPGGVITVL
jgi:hypothetical protein